MTTATPIRNIEDYRGPIEEALRYADDSHTFDDIRDMVESGRLQFWPGDKSVIISEIIEYPRYKVLHFFLAGGGSLAELQRMTPLIEEWGHTQGCRKASLTGRKGWERTFILRDGWRHTLSVFEKSLDVERG